MATIHVPGDYSTVQAAVNAAVAGDVIQCHAGQTFTESVLLPNKGVLGSYITITTDASPANLPLAGVRTSPSYAPFMPTIQSPGGGATTIQVATGANHYKLQHLHLPEVPHGFNSIVTIGYGDSTQQFFADEPTDIIVDQCYIHGGLVCGQKRGIECDGRRITISNNWIERIKSVGQDSQAVGGFNGHGPLTITNNYLSAGATPFIYGGGDPPIRTLMTLTGTATQTTANVTCTEASHRVDEMPLNQALSIKCAGVWRFTTLRSATGGSTGTITFDAVTAVPDVPGGARAGCVLGAYGPGTGLTFQFNWVRNDPAWELGNLPPVANVSATTTSGSLAAGTYFYTWQAFSTDGYKGITVNGAESLQVQATLGAPGGILVTGDAVAGATSYQLWRGSTSGTRTQFVTVATPSKVDDGTLGWTTATPGGATPHTIKNLFELKACQNAQIDSNVFENVWYNTNDNAQGFAFWCKSANQGNSVPGDANGLGTFIQTRDVVFEKNIIRNCFGFAEFHGVEIPAGMGYGFPGPLTNVTVRNNLLYFSGRITPWSNGNHDGYCLQATAGVVNLTLDHNTLDHTTGDDQNTGAGGLLTLDSTDLKLSGLVVTNNMLRRETYGIHDPTATGTGALDAAAPGWVFLKNAVAEAPASQYPTGNFYDSTTLSAWQGQFQDYPGQDYHIKAASAYHHAGTDGKDLGCDVDLVLAATAGVASGAGPGPVSTHRRHGRFHR